MMGNAKLGTNYDDKFAQMKRRTKMYNSFKKDTRPWWAMKEAIEVHADLENASDAVASAFETIIGEMDDIETERDELEEERDQIQTEYDELKEKYETLHGAQSEMVTQFTNIKMAAEAITKYANTILVQLGATNDVQEGNSDSSD